MRRAALVRDEEGRWFLRGIAYSVEDGVRGEMVYNCDEDLGGPFRTLTDAAHALIVVDANDGD